MNYIEDAIRTYTQNEDNSNNCHVNKKWKKKQKNMWWRSIANIISWDYISKR